MWCTAPSLGQLGIVDGSILDAGDHVTSDMHAVQSLAWYSGVQRVAEQETHRSCQRKPRVRRFELS